APTLEQCSHRLGRLKPRARNTDLWITGGLTRTRGNGTPTSNRRRGTEAAPGTGSCRTSAALRPHRRAVPRRYARAARVVVRVRRRGPGDPAPDEMAQERPYAE